MLMVLLGSGNGLSNGVKNEFAENAINVMWMWTGGDIDPVQRLEGRTSGPNSTTRIMNS